MVVVGSLTREKRGSQARDALTGNAQANDEESAHGSGTRLLERYRVRDAMCRRLLRAASAAAAATAAAGRMLAGAVWLSEY